MEEGEGRRRNVVSASERRTKGGRREGKREEENEPQVDVEIRDSLELLGGEVEVGGVEVLGESVGVVGFLRRGNDANGLEEWSVFGRDEIKRRGRRDKTNGDDSDSSLGSPSEKHLGRS